MKKQYRFGSSRLQISAVALLLAMTSPELAAPTTGTLTITRSHPDIVLDRPQPDFATLTLREDHMGDIIIGEDFIVLNCQGNTVSGTGTGAGITVIGRVGVRVENCMVTDFAKGVVLNGSVRGFFLGNRVNENREEGFDLESSHGNLFISNSASRNGGDGFDLEFSNGNFFSGNGVILNGANGIELDDSDNNIFLDNQVSSNGREQVGVPPDFHSGFSLDRSKGNIFQENIASENGQNGFRIDRGSDQNSFILNTGFGNREPDVFQREAFRNWFHNNQFGRGSTIFGIPGAVGDGG